jgi:WD40 repeat protein
MQHTYLRYECADAFGLTTTSSSSKAPQSNSILAFLGTTRNRPIVLTTAGSHCMGFHLRTAEATIKLGHREQLSGGVGTGRALNSDQVVCVTVAQQEGGVSKVATGWVDGAVRVFDVQSEEIHQDGGSGLVQSLLQQDSNDQEDFVMREPLVLNGHSSSPVRSLAFSPQNASRLASGSSDGSVVLWDIVAETGLFRLLGHRGGITDIQFVMLGNLDLLISTSLDGLVKVWDLKAQCCTQTIPTHRGEVWGAACQIIPSESDDNEGQERVRLLTGSTDGQVRVWSVETPKRYKNELAVAKNQKGEENDADMVDGNNDNNNNNDDDNVCSYMGSLTPPANVSTSSERISCIHYHPNGKFVGVLHANSKNVDVYLIRSVQESLRKKQRRLRRRKEKSKMANKSTESQSQGPKRGMLDDPESEDEKGANAAGELNMDQSLDPEMIKASDEFEYFGTARASHKVKGFVFVPYKEQGAGIRLVCSLSTNALEVHSLVRKKEG